MDYVLWIYGAAALIAVVAAALLARRYAYAVTAPLPVNIEPTYRKGSPSWIAQQERRRAALRTAVAVGNAAPAVVVEWPFADEPTADEVAAEVAELEAQIARVTAPEVKGETIVHWEAPPTFARGQLDHAGAEQWGDLFDQMRTEERTIYNAQMVQDHDAHMEVEREFLSELDVTVNRVLAELAEANDAAERRARYWERTAAARADFDDAPTGVFRLPQYV